MHEEAFKRFDTAIKGGATLMFHQVRKCYDLALTKRQIQEKEASGYSVVEYVETPPEAKAAPKRRGRKPKTAE